MVVCCGIVGRGACIQSLLVSGLLLVLVFPFLSSRELSGLTPQFFGHVFTKDGLNPSPDKVRAVKECGVPENKEAVRSFLGMAGYLNNFIQNNAAIATPLYQLTRK